MSGEGLHVVNEDKPFFSYVSTLYKSLKCEVAKYFSICETDLLNQAFVKTTEVNVNACNVH